MSEDPESALVGELRRIAKTDRDTSRFTVREGGHLIQVVYSGGSSSSLELSAGYDRVARKDHPAIPQTYRDGTRGSLTAPRPLAIELRPENGADVQAKQIGLSAEWQSGDDAFDRAVYVSTPTTDATVLAAVLGSEVRSSVLELFELGFRRIGIDEEGSVKAHLSEFASPRPSAGRGARALHAFAKILAHLPAITASGQTSDAMPLAGWMFFFKVVGIAGWALNVGYVGLLLFALRALRPAAQAALTTGALIGAIAFGVVGGFIGGMLFSRTMRERVRGTSRAHERAAAAFFAGFGGISVLLFTFVVILLAVFG